MSNTTAVVIYHKNCLDGFGAAYAAWLKLGNSAEYLAMDYHERDKIYELDIEGKSVYVLDFSFSKEATDYIKSKANFFIWLDHHKTSFEEHGYSVDKEVRSTSTKEYIRLTTAHCGAILSWHYFHPDASIPILIEHIDDRDRWQWKLEGTKEILLYLDSLPKEFRVWDGVCEECDESPEDLIEYGKAINTYYKKQLQIAIESTREECSFPGVAKGLCCNLPPMFASDAGHELAKQSGTFGATWFKDKDGNIKWSLRSIGDFDVSAIAKQFSGGGHKNAAGFTIVPDSGLTKPGVVVTLINLESDNT